MTLAVSHLRLAGISKRVSFDPAQQRRRPKKTMMIVSRCNQIEPELVSHRISISISPAFIKALPVSEEDITLASAKKMQPTRTPVDEPKSVDIDQRIDSTSQNGSRANSTKSSKSDDEEVKRVNISNQSLKAILISEFCNRCALDLSLN